MASRLQIAKPDIVDTFAQGKNVLRINDIAGIFSQHRHGWRLAQNTSLHSFIAFLVEKTELREVRFAFPQREVMGYTWGRVPLLETLLRLVEGSYYSHYTAMRFHGLTEQVPKTIYLNQEKSRGSSDVKYEGRLFDQASIDAAFRRPPRASNNEIELPEDQCRVVMLQSAYHKNTGIIKGGINYGSKEPLMLRYTNLERTMIDIVIRPFYAGGVFEVAKAFEKAKGQLSVNRMSAMLKKMAFGYPYHQSIGYYLERADYKGSLIDIFRRQPMERDFYIAHGMGKESYKSQWRLYVPEGF